MEQSSYDIELKHPSDPVCKCLLHGSVCTCLVCDHSPIVSDHVCICSGHASDCKCNICIPTPKVPGPVCVCRSHGSICKCKICMLTPTVPTPSISNPVCVCARHDSVCKCLVCIRTPTASDYCVCASHASDCKCPTCIRTPTVSDRVCTYASHVSICKCFTCMRTPSNISEKIEISARKQQILSIVSRTENYIKEHRIAELIRFLLTKLVSECSDKPIQYLEKILDDCMLYRAGYGLPPVLYEQRHLEAVMKSFDPGQRGWITTNQLRRAYSILNLKPPNIPDDERIPTDIFLKTLKFDQETELFELVSAGTVSEEQTSIKI